MRTSVLMLLLLLPGALARAEEPGFALSSGITLAEPAVCTEEGTESVRIRKIKKSTKRFLKRGSRMLWSGAKSFIRTRMLTVLFSGKAMNFRG